MVDLQNDRIRFHRTPEGGNYRDVTSAMKSGSMPVPGLPAAEIDLG